MKRFFRSRAATGVLFLLAIALLMTGSIGGTRAALNIQSGIYESQLSLSDIGVTLTENGKSIASRDFKSASRNWSTTHGDLVNTMVKDAGDKALKIGKTYHVDFGVLNTGTIPQYTRVTIYRYWVDSTGRKIDEYGWFDGEGTKKLNLDPKLIDIHLTNEAEWRVDNAPSESGERIVLYYIGNGGVLGDKNDTGHNASIFADAVTISPDIAKAFERTSRVVKGEDGVTRRIYSYAYNDVGFVLDIQVDAVQTHNASDAMTSAWGRTNWD